MDGHEGRDGNAAAMVLAEDQQTPATASWRMCLTAFPALAALTALLFAATGELGWIFDAELLKTFIPGLPTMKPTTSVMLMALAGSLLLSCRCAERDHQMTALAGAVFVALFSGAFLLQGDALTDTPSLWLAPSAATSLTLFILALSLAMLQADKPLSRAIAAAAIFACLLPLHRLITFVVGYGTLQTSGPFDSMSLPTALSLFLLACGTFLNPRLPYAGQLTAATLQGRVLRLTLPWTVLVPPLLAVLFATGIGLGLYNADFVIVAVAAALSVMMTALLWQLALHLQRIDGRRGEAERILRESEAYANQIIEAAPDAMVVVAETGKIVRANARMEQLFGYRRDELLGQAVDILLPERFRAGHQDFLSAFFANPTPHYIGEGRDLYIRCKDGSEVAVEIALAILETPQGRNVLANIVDISGRLRAQAAIEAALTEKTLLLNEVHHRVKNNLQIVASLLSLQAGMVKDEAFTALLAESESRVRAMALMHQILYERKDFAHVELDIYLQRLASLLDQIHGAASRGIAVRVDCQRLSLDLTHAIPLGLIVNELLSNAFKHAFPTDGGGEVWIELHEVPHAGARLVVRDNGRGLPDEAAMPQSDTLGMQIVSLLAEQIGASLEVGEGPGGRFELCFQPLPPDHTDEAEEA
jgi:PAS domain S-box-containing protein